MRNAMSEVFVREATAADLAAISAIDSANTGLAKPDYWQGLFDGAAASERSFLVAEAGGPVIGFVVLRRADSWGLWSLTRVQILRMP